MVWKPIPMVRIHRAPPVVTILIHLCNLNFAAPKSTRFPARNSKIHSSRERSFNRSLRSRSNSVRLSRRAEPVAIEKYGRSVVVVVVANAAAVVPRRNTTMSYERMRLAQGALPHTFRTTQATPPLTSGLPRDAVRSKVRFRVVRANKEAANRNGGGLSTAFGTGRRMERPSAQHLVVHFDRLSAVDRQDVLRAG